MSLSRRLDRLRDTLLPPGSLEWREWALSAELAASLQSHRTRTDAIILALEKWGAGEAYRVLILDREASLPPMPEAVRSALFGDSDTPTITPDATLNEVAAIYAQMIEGFEQ